MTRYVNVYGRPGKTFFNVFQAVIQNSESIERIEKDYARIGLIYLSKDCRSYDVQQAEKLSALAGFMYDVSTPQTGKIIASELYMGDVTYTEILGGVAEEIEHLRLHARGVPPDKHHDRMTRDRMDAQALTLKPFILSQADRSRLIDLDTTELLGWTVTYVPLVRSGK